MHLFFLVNGIVTRNQMIQWLNVYQHGWLTKRTKIFLKNKKVPNTQEINKQNEEKNKRKKTQESIYDDAFLWI